MLLGKRPRPQMKRTTSMTEITLDLDLCIGDAQPPPHQHQQPPSSGGGQLDQRFLAANVSPRNHSRNSIDFVETPHFLRACFLCKRRLVPRRDIYMYRGDSAFCSLECRQQQMSIDERKEKCSSTASKKEAVPVAAAASGSAKAETIAAV